MDSEILETLRSIDKKLAEQNAIGLRTIAELGGVSYGTGLFVALGMNLAVQSQLADSNLLACLLSWGNVGWLLMMR
jgi:transketolase N-terminal domain/subunit